jgi:hypothetical protein
MAEADEAKPKKDPKDNKVKVKPMKLLWHDPDSQSFPKPTPHVYLPGATVGSIIQLDISPMCLAYWKSDQRHYQAYLKGGVLLSSLFDDAVSRPMALAMLRHGSASLLPALQNDETFSKGRHRVVCDVHMGGHREPRVTITYFCYYVIFSCYCVLSAFHTSHCMMIVNCAI